MTGWFGYARPFARRRRAYRKTAARYLRALDGETGLAERGDLWRCASSAERYAEVCRFLWRDFIAHMERRG